MKRETTRTNLSRFAALTLLSLAAVVDSGCGRPADAEEPGRFYDDTLWEGFSVKFPESWELKENFMESRVTAISPLKGKKDFFQEYVAVLSEVVPFGVTLEEYMNISLQNIHKEVGNVKVVKRGEAEIGGEEAKWLSFRLKMYGASLKGAVYAVIRGRYAYVIVCQGTSKSYSKNRKRFKSIVESFRFE